MRGLGLLRLAIAMLLGDARRAAMIIFGVTLSSALMMQQVGLFIGLIERSQNGVADAAHADLWLMHPATRHYNLAKPIPAEAEAARIRGLPGVAWAAPYSKSALAVEDAAGRARNAVLIGLDDATFAGAPQRWFLGGPEALRAPGAVAIDRLGYKKLWPGLPLKTGRSFDLGGEQVVVAAITEAAPIFGAEVLIHMSRSLKSRVFPRLNPGSAAFILVGLEQAAEPVPIAERLSRRTGLKVIATAAFSEQTKGHYLANTGVASNFMTTILLGVVAGAAMVGLTFSLFIADNMGAYAVLKTVGLKDGGLAGLALLQVFALTSIGFAIGAAVAYGFFAGVAGPDSALRGFRLEAWIVWWSLAAVCGSVLLATSVGLWRVHRADPALVFQEPG